MLDRLTNFLSAFFIRAREASNVTAGPARREGFLLSDSAARSARTSEEETPQAVGPGQVRYSFSTARMIAL